MANVCLACASEGGRGGGRKKKNKEGKGRAEFVRGRWSGQLLFLCVSKWEHYWGMRREGSRRRRRSFNSEPKSKRWRGEMASFVHTQNIELLNFAAGCAERSKQEAPAHTNKRRMAGKQRYVIGNGTSIRILCPTINIQGIASSICICVCVCLTKAALDTCHKALNPCPRCPRPAS